MNFQLSLENINEFGQKAKILQKNEKAHEIQKKDPVYVRACFHNIRERSYSMKENFNFESPCGQIFSCFYHIFEYIICNQ